MDGLRIRGVAFRPVYFTPTFSKHANLTVRGVHAIPLQADFDPV